MKITNLNQIRASIKTNWSNPNMKFKPGDVVQVSYPKSYDSAPIRLRKGWSGKVVAVSCSSDGTIRGRDIHNARQFTRYFVQFADDRIIGIHSHTLTN